RFRCSGRPFRAHWFLLHVSRGVARGLVCSGPLGLSVARVVATVCDCRTFLSISTDVVDLPVWGRPFRAHWFLLHVSRGVARGLVCSGPLGLSVARVVATVCDCRTFRTFRTFLDLYAGWSFVPVAPSGLGAVPRKNATVIDSRYNWRSVRL